MFDALTVAAQQAIGACFGLNDVPVVWLPTGDSARGDIATSIALRLAKQLGKSPMDIASAIAMSVAAEPQVARAEAALPGYVNVTLTDDALLQLFQDAQAALRPAPARTDIQPVIVEYSQPNIAKPLAIHHIIGTVLGQALVNLYKHAGIPTISWNYIGDWGTQFGKLAVAYEKWGSEKPVKEYSLDALLKLYVKFHEEVRNDESLETQGREAFRKLEAGDEALRSFWQDVVAVTKASLADIYTRLHVSFDLDLGESFYENKMAPILEEGKKKGVFVQGNEGSLIVQFPEEMNMPPYLVLKGDGATLYSTRDIAQMRYRIDTYHPQKILILTDIAQKLHFEQLVETCKQLGWQLPEFENVLFGRMRFADKSMSTRKGNVLKLEEVLDEAAARAEAIIAERGDAIQTDDPRALAQMMGSGALVYGILSQNRKMDMVFDWDKMLSFDGNSAPYLQYTHARAQSILRKAGEWSAPQRDVLFSPEDRSLALRLLQVQSVLDESRAAHLPHKLTQYLFDLSQEFNSYYSSVPILQAEQDSRLLRLALCSRVAEVLRVCGELLTLRMPERM